MNEIERRRLARIRFDSAERNDPKMGYVFAERPSWNDVNFLLSLLDKYHNFTSPPFPDPRHWQPVPDDEQVTEDTNCEACDAGYRLAKDGLHYNDEHGGRTWGVCRKVVASLDKQQGNSEAAANSVKDSEGEGEKTMGAIRDEQQAETNLVTGEFAKWWICFPCWKAYYVPTSGYFGPCPDCKRPTLRWPGDPNKTLSMIEFKWRHHQTGQLP